jgi:hypothetical protein
MSPALTTTRSTYLALTTRAQGIPSVAVAYGRRSTKSASPVPRKLLHLQMAASSRRYGFRHVLVVSENEPPRHGLTDSEEAAGSKGTPTAPSDVRKNNVVWSLPVLETFVLSLRKQGSRRLTIPRPTWVWLYGASPASRPNT